MSEANTEKAGRVFESLCAALDSEGWKYAKDAENLKIESSVRGDDMPIDIRIKVLPEQEVVLLLSELPYVFSEDKRLDGAIAVSIVNDRLVNGCFDYDIKNGSVWFRMTNSYADSDLGAELFKYMLFVSCGTVDDYNDKFVSIGLGATSPTDLLSDN